MQRLDQILANMTLQKNWNPTFRDEAGNPVRCPTCSRVLQEKEGKPYCFYCAQISSEDHKLAIETQAEHENMRFRKQMDAFKQNSLINEKLKAANFSTYQPCNPDQERALNLCKRYGMNFNLEKPTSLLIYGPYGTGKSHLAKSVTDIVMEKDVTCLFISVPKLMTKLKGTFGKKDLSEYDLLETIAKIQFLVLDDLGAERNSAAEDQSNWAKTKLFEIFDSRAGKHTIITTNFDLGGLLKVYGEREISRFLEDATPLHVPGENYRMRNFKAGK